MKKIIAIVALLALVLTLFAGCQTPKDPDVLHRETLSDELKTKIKNKIVLKYDEVIYWEGLTLERAEPYYGTINNCIVVQYAGVDRMSLGNIAGVNIDIAGYVFEAPDYICLYAYRDGEVCKLQEAYEQGWLTKEHVGKIHERHKEIYATWLNAQEEAKSNHKET